MFIDVMLSAQPNSRRSGLSINFPLNYLAETIRGLTLKCFSGAIFLCMIAIGPTHQAIGAEKILSGQIVTRVKVKVAGECAQKNQTLTSLAEGDATVGLEVTRFFGDGKGYTIEKKSTPLPLPVKNFSSASFDVSFKRKHAGLGEHLPSFLKAAQEHKKEICAAYNQIGNVANPKLSGSKFCLTLANSGLGLAVCAVAYEALKGLKPDTCDLLLQQLGKTSEFVDKQWVAGKVKLRAWVSFDKQAEMSQPRNKMVAKRSGELQEEFIVEVPCRVWFGVKVHPYNSPNQVVVKSSRQVCDGTSSCQLWVYKTGRATLSARAAKGWRFSHWSGNLSACDGGRSASNNIKIKDTDLAWRDLHCLAHFEEDAANNESSDEDFEKDLDDIFSDETDIAMKDLAGFDQENSNRGRSLYEDVWGAQRNYSSDADRKFAEAMAPTCRHLGANARS